jgi:integrase
MTPQQHDAFRDWLEDQGYAPSTVETCLRNVAHACDAIAEGTAGEDLPYYTRKDCVRALKYGRGWSSAETQAFQARVDARRTKLQETRARQAQRARTESSIGDEAWGRLLDLTAEGAAEGDPQDAVLYLMMRTGLRIGDVLRLTRQRLQGGLRSEAGVVRLVQKGGEERRLPVAGAPDAWQYLAEACAGAPTVALAVAPDSDGSPIAGAAPYKRVQRRMHARADEAGVEGRMHTHRLRRTVAVQAIRSTGQVETARQLLGHRSLHATLRYVDEASPEDLARMQRDLAERFE